MRVMIVVTHLLGVGHLARAAALGRRLARGGHRVTLVSGGRAAPNVPVEGLAFVQLPALHARGTDFKTLYTDDGSVAAAAVLAERQRLLCATAREFRPDALVIELFPFGRRQLAAEFLAVLEDIPAQTAVFASVRDVLAPPSSPKKAAQTIDILGRRFDRVLVHGDAAVLPLEASWPVTPALARRLVYTGYLRDQEAAPVLGGGTEGAGEILVSGGGSDAALPMFGAALAAARQMPQQRWRLLVGHGVAEPDFLALQGAAAANTRVERVRRDFAAMLGRAACSVSLGGYNTMLDLAAADVPAVVVPFDGGHEVEQAIRATCFSAMGLVEVVRLSDLTGETLATAVQRAVVRQQGGKPRLAMDGADGAARAIEAEVAETQALAAAWARVIAALDAAAALGRTIEVWWRDDDAVAPTPELDRLLALAAEVGAPLALAVIPETVQPALAQRLAGEADVCVLVHGIAHRNHAPLGQKKQELLAADAATLDGLRQGLEKLSMLFNSQALPVLAPPWNRISPDIIAQLSALGFAGLSTHAHDRHARDGLIVVDTHLDPIDWKGGGGAVCASAHIGLLAKLIEDRVSARGQEAGQEAGPIGILTHHLVHDGWIWRSVEDMMHRLGAHRAVRFVGAAASFGLTGAAGNAPKDR